MNERETYTELRPLLFSIAYRMIGQVTEAEDIVQEAFMRFHLVSDQADLLAQGLSVSHNYPAGHRLSALGQGAAPRPTSGPGSPSQWSTTLFLTQAGTRKWPTRCRCRSWLSWKHCHRSSEQCSCCERCSTMGTRRWPR